MKSWKRAFGVLMIISFPLGLAVAADVDKGPANIRIDTGKSPMPVPNFTHHKHQELMGGDASCVKCHHKSKPGEKPPKCTSCHSKEKNATTGALGYKDAFHKLCQDCHKKQKDKPQLATCKNCHAK